MAGKNKTKRFQTKLHVKKGDKVKVIAGNDKGKVSEVLQVLPEKNRAIVADVNMVLKHKKPTNDNSGGIVEEPAPVHISNLMLVDGAGEASRVGRKKADDGRSVRYSKKSGEII